MSSSERASEKRGDSTRYERCNGNRDQRSLGYELRGRHPAGYSSATKTLRNVEGAWVKDQNVMIEDGNIKGYKVNLEITFVLDE